MRSILEKAIVHLLNEEHDQAEALFHKFIVGKARQIHESLRTGDDVLNENFDSITSEQYFTEADLESLEGDDAGEEAGDEFGGEDLGDFGGDEAGSDEGEAEVAADDFGDASDEIDAAADDLEGDLGGEGELADRVADLEQQIADLTAEFAEIMGDDAADLGGEDLGDFGGEEGDLTDPANADLGDVDSLGGEEGEEGGDDLSADTSDLGDDMEDEVKESEEVEEDDFADITESIIAELEKVSVTMTDGKEVGAGKSFSQNNTSPALQKKPNPQTDGKPVQVKASEHKGFERETAPAVKDMKKRRNTKSNAEDGQSKVSKEGDKSAELNKLKSDGNNTSPLAKR